MNYVEKKQGGMDYNYEEELKEKVLPFWLNHSIDKNNGGFFSCLDEKGKVYDTDKFIWLQARQVWTFATMYKELKLGKEYLEAAINGADFLLKYGRDMTGNWFFSLDEKGSPLVQPYNIFSDCFAAMAFAALYKVEPREEYAIVAKETFDNILQRKTNPKRQWEKKVAGTRDLQNFSLPMILCNLSLEMEHLLDQNQIDILIDEVVNEVMDVFYQSEYKVVLENVDNQGRFNDSFDGRLFNPGHNLEAMWFIMDLGVRLNNRELILRAKEISLDVLKRGWDSQYGGIFYFLDIKGNPPQQLEWDQKLWWVHLEAMVCMLKAYELTQDPLALQWFKKIEKYSWKNFRDAEGGEWFGYLNRQGEVFLPLKGGKWKGCFHVPRALLQIMKTKKSIEGIKDKVEH